MSTPRTIVGLTVTSGAVATVAGAARDGRVNPRIVAGTAVATVGFLALSDVAPRLALSLAVVMFMTAMLTSGPTVIAKFDPTK